MCNPLRISLVAMVASIAVLDAQQESSSQRQLFYTSGKEIAAQLRPEDRLVRVTKIQSPPSVRAPVTLDEELTRLESFAHAIVVFDAESVQAVLTPRGDWAVTKISGKVHEVIKSSHRAQIVSADGQIQFQFDGGELRLGKATVRVGDYPILNSGERYLVMFRLDPGASQWYPFLPFRITDAGRLELANFFRSTSAPVTSPLDGQTLSALRERLQAR